MDTADYTKRELDEHFTDLSDSVSEIKDLVKDLNTKVGIQNGRVGKLEGKANGLVMGGTVAVFLLGIIMSLIVYSFQIAMENQKSSILLDVSTMLKK